MPNREQKPPVGAETKITLPEKLPPTGELSQLFAAIAARYPEYRLEAAEIEQSLNAYLRLHLKLGRMELLSNYSDLKLEGEQLQFTVQINFHDQYVSSYRMSLDLVPVVHNNVTTLGCQWLLFNLSKKRGSHPGRKRRPHLSQAAGRDVIEEPAPRRESDAPVISGAQFEKKVEPNLSYTERKLYTFDFRGYVKEDRAGYEQGTFYRDTLVAGGFDRDAEQPGIYVGIDGVNAGNSRKAFQIATPSDITAYYLHCTAPPALREKMDPAVRAGDISAKLELEPGSDSLAALKARAIFAGIVYYFKKRGSLDYFLDFVHGLEQEVARLEGYGLLKRTDPAHISSFGRIDHRYTLKKSAPVAETPAAQPKQEESILQSRRDLPGEIETIAARLLSTRVSAKNSNEDTNTPPPPAAEPTSAPPAAEKPAPAAAPAATPARARRVPVRREPVKKPVTRQALERAMPAKARDEREVYKGQRKLREKLLIFLKQPTAAAEREVLEAIGRFKLTPEECVPAFDEFIARYIPEELLGASAPEILGGFDPIRLNQTRSSVSGLLRLADSLRLAAVSASCQQLNKLMQLVDAELEQKGYG